MQSSTHENEYDLESGRVQMLLHFLWNLYVSALSSTYVKENDPESGIGPDASPFPLEFVYRCIDLDVRELI